MSNQLHQGEEQRRKQVKIRAPERLVEEFDEWCDEQGQSRSEALRQAMTDSVERTVEWQTPLQPPADDEQLADAYRRLCALASRDGLIPAETAETALASALNMDKTSVRRAALVPLDKRGYINFRMNTREGAIEIAGYQSATPTTEPQPAD